MNLRRSIRCTCFASYDPTTKIGPKRNSGEESATVGMPTPPMSISRRRRPVARGTSFSRKEDTATGRPQTEFLMPRTFGRDFCFSHAFCLGASVYPGHFGGFLLLIAGFQFWMSLVLRHGDDCWWHRKVGFFWGVNGVGLGSYRAWNRTMPQSSFVLCEFMTIWCRSWKRWR